MIVQPRVVSLPGDVIEAPPRLSIDGRGFKGYRRQAQS
jgi:hypothetical protein